MISRIAMARGLGALSDMYFARGKAQVGRSGLLADGQASAPSFEVGVKEQLSSRAFDFLSMRLVDRRLTRSTLLASFEDFQASFFGTGASNEADSTVAILRRMVKEDSTHGLETVGQRARELIYRLRDEGPESVNWRASKDLEEMGAGAMPSLIDAIPDQSFTLGFFRRMGTPSPFRPDQILRVGDEALRLVEKFAGRRFEGKSRKEIQNAARTWWEGSPENKTPR